MAQSIKFYGGYGNLVNDISGSGLGFYGSGGTNSPVGVGAYQDNTWITNSTGNATDAIKVNNIKYVAPGSGELAGADLRVLREVPNYLASLKISLQSDTPIRAQNGQLRIYDRINHDHSASGLIAQGCVLIHPWNTQTPAGSGSTSWQSLGGSGSILNFGAFPASISPGFSGLSPSGSNTVSLIHDFFCGLSVSPTSIGSKAFAAEFSVEFL
jgi:hypothetical protein